MGDEYQFDEEPLSIEISKNNTMYIARILIGLNVIRTYSSDNIEDVIEQFVIDLQEGIDRNSKSAVSDEENQFNEELLCNVEISKEDDVFIARIQSDLGGIRDCSSNDFEDVIERLAIELQDEFESL